MKNRKKFIALGSLVLVMFFGLNGCSYYKDTYSGQTAYAKVSETVPEKVQTKDSQGEVQEGLYSLNYTFDFVKEDGTKQVMTYELVDKDPQPLEPGSYVRAVISKKRIIKGPNGIKQEEIPEKVRETLG